MSDNQLCSLLESIGNLTELRQLYLEHNELTSLPESIGNLTRLEELHVKGNRLTFIREVFISLKKRAVPYISDVSWTIKWKTQYISVERIFA
ncbi:MAG: leucine-rich repeat domain-containing protein [Theionarchaea archaeon]|nr:leucine-rich repeat domain-containing protein [Theionarchaea archaeon]